jgi:hypothetical protein
LIKVVGDKLKVDRSLYQVSIKNKIPQRSYPNRLSFLSDCGGVELRTRSRQTRDRHAANNFFEKLRNSAPPTPLYPDEPDRLGQSHF